jgi:hypothetical protein
MTKFKVGDTVLVVSPGNTYTTYDVMFNKLGFRNTGMNDIFSKGQTAVVFAVEKHPDSGITLLALEKADGAQSLISAQGVTKVISTPSQLDKFDIIREFCDSNLVDANISDKQIFVYLLDKVEKGY